MYSCGQKCRKLYKRPLCYALSIFSAQNPPFWFPRLSHKISMVSDPHIQVLFIKIWVLNTWPEKYCKDKYFFMQPVMSRWRVNFLEKHLALKRENDFVITNKNWRYLNFLFLGIPVRVRNKFLFEKYLKDFVHWNLRKQRSLFTLTLFYFAINTKIITVIPNKIPHNTSSTTENF